MVRWCVGVALASAALAFAGLAFASSSYPDAAGDNNEAPDLRTVTLAEAPDGTVSVAVGVGNYESLPADSWINVWFDLDSDQSTGYDGDEALVQYLSTGVLAFYRWNGTGLTKEPTTGITGSFASGVLTLTVPKEAVGGLTAFGVLAIAARSQAIGDIKFIASDAAPDSGRSAYVGPTQMAFVDLTDDHDSAPDITTVQVSDAKSGWIRIAVTTPNYAQLPPNAVLLLSIDRDNHVSTGDSGTELQITALNGEMLLERWDPSSEDWIDDKAPTRARVLNSGNVVTFEIHESELENTPSFGFAIVALDVDTRSETVRAVDVVPDSKRYYKYRLANKPALLLTATNLFGTPSRPSSGKRFTVNLGVRRSDTSRGIRSGAVVCNVVVAKRQVPARGGVAGGNAHCTFVVPSGTNGATLRGTITVRTDGTSVSQRFAYVVR